MHILRFAGYPGTIAWLFGNQSAFPIHQLVFFNLLALAVFAHWTIGTWEP